MSPGLRTPSCLSRPAVLERCHRLMVLSRECTMRLCPLLYGKVHGHIAHSPGDIWGLEDLPSSVSMSLCDCGQVVPPSVYSHVMWKSKCTHSLI